MVPASLSQPDLLQRGRQGWSLRGMGGAGTLQRRGSRCLPAAPQIDLNRRAVRVTSAPRLVRAATLSGTRRGTPMKTYKLLIAAVLAIAIGAPIAGFLGERSV